MFLDKPYTLWYNIYIYGSIDRNPVTVRQVTGRNAGQTLIADGHVSGKQFHGQNGQKGHNHYGQDTKYGTSKRIEDLGGDRGKYTGSGIKLSLKASDYSGAFQS